MNTNLQDIAEEQNIPVKNNIKDLFSFMNKIALNIIDDIVIPDQLISGFPIKWDLHQIYLLLKYFYQIKPFSNYCYVIINEELSAIDLFLVNTDKIEEKHIESNFTLKFNFSEIENTEEKSSLLKEISIKIKKMEPFQEELNLFLKSDEIFRTIIIPSNIKEILTESKIPLLNLNIFNAFEAIDNFKDQIILKFGLPFVNYAFSLIESQGLLLTFLKDMIVKAKNEELPKWSTIISTLLEGTMANIVIISKATNQILFAFRTIVEDNTISINPLAWKIIKKCNAEKLQPKEIANLLYSITGFRTQAIFDHQLLKILKEWNQSGQNIFDLFADLFSISYTSIWSPDSLLNEFLKLFGFELGKGAENFGMAIKVVIQYFQNILIVVYKNGEDDRSYNTLVKFSVKDNKPIIDIIDTKPFIKYFNQHQDDSLSRLKGIKNAVEESLEVNFKGCFGFDIKILSESLSAKNIQALLSVNTMAHQLPFVATIGALFTGMKALGVEKALKGEGEEEPFLQIHKNSVEEESNLTSNKMKFINYFDAFLKKGILFIGSEDRDMHQIRSPIFSKDGYLGLDAKALRELISKQKKSKKKK
ncbi:hypothetical protein DSAG12_02191 [Promethearchaeum syntrophicum]|uniref:Uncharacterized protein n=1 Tax=Promethearchaeum syntrophicum TaxID=2594042 RepID=A0A5B9DBG5_9ARCH|nr:hypothetical protein [Candidatus Prometheoarchaeum syntrophicum]QEE16361.1 hypothetical protein DSAG12_02191 [Candidatus Prometheoarchaeum syntrophicum]